MATKNVEVLRIRAIQPSPGYLLHANRYEENSMGQMKCVTQYKCPPKDHVQLRRERKERWALLNNPPS